MVIVTKVAVQLERDFLKQVKSLTYINNININKV